MAWKVESIMSQRHEFCKLACEPGSNISALCQQFQITRRTGYKWLRRYREEGADGLWDRSHRPHLSPDRTDAAVEAQVVALRLNYPYWGPRKLHRLMKDRLAKDQLPAIATVARILKRNGLIETPAPKLVWPAVGRFEHPYPNDLWQMDLKAPIRLPDRQKIYPVGLLDDHSRYLLGLWMMPDCRDDGIIKCWLDASCQHGFPKRTLTDHGVQFRGEDNATSAFRTMLWACGVAHTQGRVAHPQTQGKIERFWKTLKTEVLTRYEYKDRASWQKCFDEWRNQYNHIRPHQELGDEPPASRYQFSERPFVAPDRRQQVGFPNSIYRSVNSRGYISLGGYLTMVGRGLTGWTVEVRPLGTGCWHVYFRHHFMREILLTKPIRDQRTNS